MVLDIGEGIAYSKLLHLRWNMDFIDASQGLPDGVAFSEKNFVPPPHTLSETNRSASPTSSSKPSSEESPQAITCNNILQASFADQE